MTMQLISTVTVGAGGASSIDFTSIPQTGTDLIIVVSGRSSAATTSSGFYAKFNSDVGANYTSRYLAGSGSAAMSASYANGDVLIGAIPGANATASTFGNIVAYIPNYAGSTAKTLSSDSIAEHNASVTDQRITAMSWTGTAGISTISLFLATSTLVQYSTASLYIITKGSGGATVTTA